MNSIVFVLILLIASNLPNSAKAEDFVSVFLDTGKLSEGDLASSPLAYQRWRKHVESQGYESIHLVKINAAKIQFMNEEQMGAELRALRFEGFDDVPIDAEFRYATKVGGRWSWIGRIQGDRFGLATLTVSGADMAGEINAFGKFFQIRSLGDGFHVVKEP